MEFVVATGNQLGAIQLIHIGIGPNSGFPIFQEQARIGDIDIWNFRNLEGIIHQTVIGPFRFKTQTTLGWVGTGEDGCLSSQRRTHFRGNDLLIHIPTIICEVGLIHVIIELGHRTRLVLGEGTNAFAEVHGAIDVAGFKCHAR